MMTATAGEERIDWIDDTGRVIEVVSRSRVRAENLLHRSVAVIVTTTDGRLVVQRRADTKDVYPGWWDIGAGGVVTSGEDPRTAARRELVEELGVDARPEYVGVERFENERVREMCSVFRLVHGGPFHPVDGEVVEIRALRPDQFAALSARAPFLPGSLTMLLPHVRGFTIPVAAWGAGARGDLPCVAVQRVEFTIEPFVEAHPGDHVTAPIAALAAIGVDAELGPFGSHCDVSAEQVGDVVATVVRTAVEHGATHINVDVTALTERERP